MSAQCVFPIGWDLPNLAETAGTFIKKELSMLFPSGSFQSYLLVKKKSDVIICDTDKNYNVTNVS